ncbi:MAG: RsmD family RNA methyltransferase [Thermotogaceae bacterium]|nr:RsmD family RNA methyltransferase [Thermotogaceae bacterium]
MIRITGGVFKGRLIHEVPDKRTRPTTSVVRQAVFNMIDVEGKSFLDLFCGSCAVLIEAISKGACCGFGVDISSRAISTCRKNIKLLGIGDKVTLYKANVLSFVRSGGRGFDVIYIDPPYGLGIAQKLLNVMKKEIINLDGVVVIEEKKDEKINLPPFLKEDKVKVYGDSFIMIARRM